MELETQMKLSYWKKIGVLNEEHSIDLVQHTITGKVFVKKTLRVYDKDVYAFLQEANLPGIPHIEEWMEDDNTLYVIEEYITGKTLRTILDEEGERTEEEAIQIIEDICTILKPLHTHVPPIVHRDIKPSNLIRTSTNQWYVLDFNAAKQSHLSRNSDTTLFGTVGYAAPEQYGFLESSPTTDVYSIGVLMNEMLVNALPSEKRVKGKCAEIIDTCLQMDPSQRFQNVTEILAALPGIKRRKSIFTSFHAWLLPGLRSGKPLSIIFAVLWYAFILFLSLTVTSTNASSEAENILYKITVFVIFMSETAFFGNYRNAKKYFPLVFSKNIIVRAFGYIFSFFFLAAFPIVVLGILIGLLHL